MKQFGKTYMLIYKEGGDIKIEHYDEVENLKIEDGLLVDTKKNQYIPLEGQEPSQELIDEAIGLGYLKQECGHMKQGETLHGSSLCSCEFAFLSHQFLFTRIAEAGGIIRKVDNRMTLVREIGDIKIVR